MICRIAGLRVALEPRYDRLARQCAGYALTDAGGAPELRVAPAPRDEARAVTAHPSAAEREYICCGAAFCRGIVPHGRFYLHASAVVLDGQAYLFAGPSGAGKSTHTALWRSQFPESYILNDDKPVLWPRPDGVTVWGTPFSGKTDLQVNRGVPLKAICFLRQGGENHIQPAAPDRALALLLHHTWRPQTASQMNQLLTMLEQVLAQAGLYEMCCTKAPEAALLSHRVMKGT